MFQEVPSLPLLRDAVTGDVSETCPLPGGVLTSEARTPSEKRSAGPWPGWGGARQSPTGRVSRDGRHGVRAREHGDPCRAVDMDSGTVKVSTAAVGSMKHTRTWNVLWRGHARGGRWELVAVVPLSVGGK